MSGKPTQIATLEGEIVEPTSLIRLDPIVRPAVSTEAAIQAWDEYQNLKKRIASKEDFQTIQGKDFPKKSLWRKLATFFNLSIEVAQEKEIKNEDGSIDFDVIYRAIAPNGRSTIGDGSCNSQEKKDRHGNVLTNSRHNTRGTAHTRAFNRAVSNLIGGGEVSAEEITDHDYQEKAERAPIPFIPVPTSPAAPTEVKNLEDYRIDLGMQKSGKPHWFNGMTLSEADKSKNPHDPFSVHKTYDFYLSKKFRDTGIKDFLAHYEVYAAKRQHPGEPQEVVNEFEDIPF